MNERANTFLKVPEDQYDRNWVEWQRPHGLAAASIESGWGHAQPDKWLLGMAVICVEAAAKDEEIAALKAELAAVTTMYKTLTTTKKMNERVNRGGTK